MPAREARRVCTRLLRQLGADFLDRTNKIEELHVYTFNDVASTERLRRELLDRMRASMGSAGL